MSILLRKRGEELVMVNLTVNAGHGPKNDGSLDPGAIGKMGLKEYQQTDQVGRLLVNKLKTRATGINTQYIQDGDLWDVSEGSDAFKANYFISLHCDSFEKANAGGITSYCLSFGGPGERLARFVQEELVKATGLSDRGVRTANFHVLRETEASAALIEIGFISNLKEEALMNSDAWDEVVTEAMFIGICKFLISEGKQITYTEGEDVLEHAVVYFTDTDFSSARIVSRKLGNCAMFCRDGNNVNIHPDALKAKHLVNLGGAEITNHPNVTNKCGLHAEDTAELAAQYARTL
jgi:N-acetylmuramoyl-L-alanine amidase